MKNKFQFKRFQAIKIDIFSVFQFLSAVEITNSAEHENFLQLQNLTSSSSLVNVAFSGDG